MRTLPRITAAADTALSVTATDATITASTTSRTLAGPLVVYNVIGRTSRGPLRVRPGALRFPDDLGRVKLTREHDRDQVRGHLAALEHTDTGIRASFRVADGPEGDDALREASDRTRDALSFDVVDATIVDGVITDALVIAGGQVGIPAYDDARIDVIAASLTTTGDNMLTPDQMARLIALRAQDTLTDDEKKELSALETLVELHPPTTDAPATPAATASAPAAPVTASATNTPAGGVTVTASAIPAVPGGVPGPAGGTVTASARPGEAMRDFTQRIVEAAPRGTAAITAALADITHADHTGIIEPPAWSGELWSGLQYAPLWTDLLNSDSLTNWEGRGWRFVTKLVMQDYAGNKVEIPTSTGATEAPSDEAARMAVGVDIDRKFYDFPNAGFLTALAEQARESWAIKLDAKVRAFVLANAVQAEGVGAQETLLKAAGVAIRALKRRRVITANGTAWVMVNDDDLFDLMDFNNLTVPAFLDLYGIDPKNFRSSQDVPAGTVLAGVNQAATVRTLPGSPLRFDAQNLARGGVDEAFFGYWAIEEHHTAGIAKSTYTPA